MTSNNNVAPPVSGATSTTTAVPPDHNVTQGDAAAVDSTEPGPAGEVSRNDLPEPPEGCEVLRHAYPQRYAPKEQPQPKRQTPPPPVDDSFYQKRVIATINKMVSDVANHPKGVKPSRPTKLWSEYETAIKYSNGAGMDPYWSRELFHQAAIDNGMQADPAHGDREIRRQLRKAEQSAGTEKLPLTDREGYDNPMGATTFTADPAPGHADNENTKRDAPRVQQRELLCQIIDAEEDFWTSRASLKHIYDAALARMCSPWAVLAHCTARALYLVSTNAVLPPLTGGFGSLNSFFVIVASSAGGKSAAEDVARELISYVAEERALGSGEGLIESFIKPANKLTGEPEGRYPALLFLADESDTIGALGSRSGSTLLPTLRSAWAAKVLSFGYRGRTHVKIEPHTYRATLVMAVQPGRAAWLLDDATGGTPQRFMWFPATDTRIRRANWDGSRITPLELPSLRAWQYHTVLEIPDCARELILTEREKANQGNVDALDGHALFCREKFAYALTILDGRTEMTDEDWRLSGIAAEVSTLTRQWTIRAVAGEADKEAEKRGRLQGVAQAEAKAEEAHRNQQRIGNVSNLVLRKLADADGPVTQRDVSRAVAGRDRLWLPPALQNLEAAGLIRKEIVERDTAGKGGPATTTVWVKVD